MYSLFAFINLISIHGIDYPQISANQRSWQNFSPKLKEQITTQFMQKTKPAF